MMSSRKITLGGIFSLSLTTRELRWMIVKKLAIQAAKAGLPMLMQQQMSRTIFGAWLCFFGNGADLAKKFLSCLFLWAKVLC